MERRPRRLTPPRNHESRPAFTTIKTIDAYIIDEPGYLSLDKQDAELLFQVISDRYECGTIVVTTRPSEIGATS